MINRIQKIFKFKRKNAKVFLFFLLFSSVVWILVQFSKTYTRIVKIPIEYVNHPLDKVLLDENPSFFNIKMTDNGFGLLYYRLFTPNLEVDLEKTTETDGTLQYLIDLNREDIEEQLGINYNKSEILAEKIVINYYQKMIKKVTVVPDITISYKIGYGSSDTIRLVPDSITVSGHERVIDTLSQITTIPLEINDVNYDLTGTIAINKETLEGVSLYQETVDYHLKVEKFTEGRLSIPLEVKNVPSGVDISIFPQEIIVIYQVNLDDYNRISANDFRVVCDFKKVDENENFLIPKVEAQPDFVKNVRLSEKKVEYVIKK